MVPYTNLAGSIWVIHRSRLRLTLAWINDENFQWSSSSSQVEFHLLHLLLFSTRSVCSVPSAVNAHSHVCPLAEIIKPGTLLLLSKSNNKKLHLWSSLGKFCWSISPSPVH